MKTLKKDSLNQPLDSNSTRLRELRFKNKFLVVNVVIVVTDASSAMAAASARLTKKEKCWLLCQSKLQRQIRWLGGTNKLFVSAYILQQLR